MAKRNLTASEKVSIVERHQSGESLKSIANSLGCNFYTVRKWWRKYRDKNWEGLTTKIGRSSQGALSNFDARIKYVALRLKLENPGWGLDVLLLNLKRRVSLTGKKLPKRTALHNYLKSYYSRFNASYRYATGRPKQLVVKPNKVHIRWQMDFKGYVSITGLGEVMPFNICDEYSSCPLQSILYRYPLNGISWRNIQSHLRITFCKWGKPLELKMDRDPLFVGSTRLEWPSKLVLWLIGLGITPIINPTATPTKNAQIERSNRTWNNHVGKTKAKHTWISFQQLMNQAWEDRRWHLPSRNPNCKGQPPMKALPQLKHSNRCYEAKTEKQYFDMNRIYQYLSKWSWKRQIDTHGRISIGGVQKAISRKHLGQIVKVHFVPSIKQFQVTDMNGTILKEFSYPKFSLEFLTQGV